MAAPETLAVRLSAELAAALRGAVEAGEYPDIDAALADAVSAWSHRHEDAEEQLAWMRAKIKASIADPRPSLSASDVRSYLKQVSARSGADGDAAA